MKYNFKNGLLWLAIYTLLALVPMAIALAGDNPPHRTFWIELGVAMGFIGLGTMALQMIFSGRIASVAPVWGMDNVLQFHREIGIVAFLFTLAHPVILLIADPEFIKYFDPTVNLPRAAALSFVTVAIFAILITSLWREALKLNYEWWRLIHGVLGFGIVFVGITHSIQVSHYLDSLWQKIAIGLTMGICAYMVIHTRVVRPWMNSKKLYKVKDVTLERGDSYTMTIAPDGFKRASFKAGQFFWMSVGDEVLKMQQHPFSVSSSDEDPNICFTAKVLGDFTATWKDIKVGTPVQLEGPFGSFTLKEDHPLFMVMGGIGVTPAMSIIRSLVDKKDKRQVILVYASENWESITYKDELDELDKLPNIEVIHSVAEPPAGYSGESGFLDKEFFEKHIPSNKNHFIYYICGPEVVMDITETSLRELGVHWTHIYSERFQIV